MTDCLHVNWFARDPGGSTAYTAPTCCDMHGRTCEPPSELCCDACTEAAHQMGDAARGVHLWDGTQCSNPDLSGELAARGQYVPVPDEGQLSVMRTHQ